MKRIISISLGSSKRDHQAEVELCGESFHVERIGTDGDMEKAIELIRQLDGKVAAFGMGGIDLYIWHGKNRYTFREAKRIARAAQKTPIVDGSGLKNTLERRVIEHLYEREKGMFEGKNVLMVCAMDRFGMAEALVKTGCRTLYGDLIFVLGLPIPLYSLRALGVVARLFAPIVVQLPFRMLYPTGEKQNSYSANSRYASYYTWADVIAGDYHYIKKNMPKRLDGKTIITNTVTPSDVEMLRAAGLRRLVTTTPNLNGRSFATNVMEALLVSILEKNVEEITAEDYLQVLDQVGFLPRIEDFSE